MRISRQLTLSLRLANLIAIAVFATSLKYLFVNVATLEKYEPALKRNLEEVDDTTKITQEVVINEPEPPSVETSRLSPKQARRILRQKQRKDIENEPIETLEGVPTKVINDHDIPENNAAASPPRIQNSDISSKNKKMPTAERAEKPGDVSEVVRNEPRKSQKQARRILRQTQGKDIEKETTKRRKIAPAEAFNDNGTPEQNAEVDPPNKNDQDQEGYAKQNQNNKVTLPKKNNKMPTPEATNKLEANDISDSDSIGSGAFSEGSGRETLCKEMFMNGMEPLSHQSNTSAAWTSNHCDKLFCHESNSNTSATCQWSYFAIDTLLENASSVCDASRTEEFFMDPPEWDTYRFSDYIRGMKRMGLSELPQVFPNSIIAEMDPTVKKRNNEAIRVIVNRIERMPKDQRVPPGTLVIHLRLGDVVEGALDSVRDLLLSPKYFYRRRTNDTNVQCHPWNPACKYNLPIEKEGNQYVKALTYYSSLEDLDQYKSVVIMGAAHLGHYMKISRTATKSCQYATALQTYLKRRMPHAEITMRMGSIPDDDILLAAQASRFVQGGGGFSAELARINSKAKINDKAHKQKSRSNKSGKSTPTALSEKSGSDALCKEMFMNGMEPLSQQSNTSDAWTSNHCDNLFCRELESNSNTSGICQWSHFAIETLLENASSVCDATRTEEFFLDPPEWDTYRFSDYIRGMKRMGLSELPQVFPNSIIAEMDPTVKKRNNEAIRVIVNRIERMPKDQRVPPGTLVIHLRLGDVVEGALDSVRDLLLSPKYFYRRRTNDTNVQCHPWNPACKYNLPIEKEGNQYVKPLSYYSSLEDLDQYKSVVIMGAAHLGHYKKRTATKSCHYATALQTYLKRRMPHAEITMRMGSVPDDDILLAAQASRFVQGGGGFSAELARINGKAMIYDKAPEKSGSEALCREMFMNGMEPLSHQSNTSAAWTSNQCNNLFCSESDSSASGICQWSHFAIDTLLENVSSVCNAPRTEEFLMDPPEWDTYRFSDYIRGMKRLGLSELPQVFPNSIIAEMDPTVKKRNNEAIRVIVNRIERMPKDQRVPPGTLVIHLRLGDVVEGAVDSVRDMLLSPKYFYRRRTNDTNVQCNPWNPICTYNLPIEQEGNQYVKPLSYYSSLVGLDRYKSVVIMGAAHLGHYKKISRTATKSCHYATALQTYLKRRMPHAEITMRMGSVPDDDILLAAQASRFVQGGGGFSAELARINEEAHKKKSGNKKLGKATSTE